MDSLITAAARALAAGDPLQALNRIALRDDAPGLALRGIAMAQLGDFDRAKTLLRRAARGFGPREKVARARCIVAEAEIAFVSRDLGWRPRALETARATLARHGDWNNAAHAGHLAVRRLLLIGRVDEAEAALSGIAPAALPPSRRATHELAVAGIAIRRLRTDPARTALGRAEAAARESGISALIAEVDSANRLLATPAARLIEDGRERLLLLDEVEALLASDSLVLDACRHAVRRGAHAISLATRPVLFALARLLCEAWPGDADRRTLLAKAFHARFVDDSHRARLRVEIGRLRAALGGLAEIRATERGFLLAPARPGRIVVLAPPVNSPHADILALLADGEAWSSSALALALDIGQRTVQRALEALSGAGKVQAFGRGRARRWMTPAVPGFPTALLLPVAPSSR